MKEGKRGGEGPSVEPCGAPEGDAAARHPWLAIHDDAVELSRLVQCGRYVSKEQMQEVGWRVHSPNGFFRQ
jgi:hypothetical protein